MLLNLLIIISSIFFITSQSEKSEVTLYFKKDNVEINNSLRSSEIMQNLFYNKIYFSSKLGKPSQNIKLYLRFNEYSSYIPENKYNKNSSSTYEFTRNNKDDDDSAAEFRTEELISGYESKELLEINNKFTMNNFNFILADELTINEKYYETVIGLNLLANDISQTLKNTNFIEQLKNYNFINKRTFSIFYEENNEYNGKIVFGKLPHEIYENDYNENDLKWVNVEHDNYRKKWTIKFDQIDFDNIQLNNTKVELVLEFNLIIAPYEFKKLVYDNFFKEYINNNLCKEEEFNNEKENLVYNFYICETSIKNNLNKKQLSFKSQTLNEIFTLSFSELFYEYNKKIYFKVIFDSLQMYNWRIGRIFFEKYPLVFSSDNNVIGYYKKDSFSAKEKNISKFWLVVCIFVILILLFLLYIICRKYSLLKNLMPRRIKANELMDNYIYMVNPENKKDKTTEMVNKGESKYYNF